MVTIGIPSVVTNTAALALSQDHRIIQRRKDIAKPIQGPRVI
jgi:hypothetical protein